MKIASSILLIGTFVNTAYGLSCWNCEFDGNQNKSCLTSPFPEDMKKIPDGMTKKKCEGEGNACAKMAFKMDLFGQSLDIVSRQCMPGGEALLKISGSCISSDTPTVGGQTVKANMCLCTSELCNAANFPVQASIMTVLISIVSVLLQKMF